jgi:AraC-like DNA-binding protein
MDALSQALSAVRMTSAIFFYAEFSAPWGFTTPDVRELAPALSPGTERLLIYHLLLDGNAIAKMDGTDDLPLAAGDILIIPHGHAHAVMDGAPPTLVDTRTAVFDRLASGHLPMKGFGGGGGATSRFACGYFGCERRAERLFLAGLPPIMKINVRADPAGQWLEHSIRHLAEEANSGRPGASMLMSKMAEALFVEALRRYMEELTPQQTGWLAAAKDPCVGRALALLHRDPRHPWSVAELAKQSGASRTVLAERFVYFLGEPPLAYLLRWRLQVAAELLKTTRGTVVQVAAEAGYESEAAFSRAFRREFGVPPARYRRTAHDSSA